MTAETSDGSVAAAGVDADADAARFGRPAQRLDDDSVDRLRDVAPVDPHGRRRLRQPARERGECPAAERLAPGEQLEQHAGQAVHVAPAADHVARGLLGAHVGRRSDDEAGPRQRLAPGLAQRLGDAEVGHHRLALVHHHVLGLDVAVDDALRVGIPQGAGHVQRDSHRLTDREGALGVEPRPQRFAADERHDVVEDAVGLAGIEQRKDVRVAEARRDLDLALKPLGAEGRGQVRMEELEGDEPSVLDVAGQVDRGHAAAPDLAFQPVVRRQRDPNAVGRVEHGRKHRARNRRGPERRAPGPV